MTEFRSDLFAHLPGFDSSSARRSQQPAVEIFVQPDTGALIHAVRQSPENISLLRKAAQRFYAVGFTGYAVDCYAQIDRLGALIPSDRLSLGRTLLSLGATDEAFSVLLANALTHSSAEILSIAGHLAEAGRHREALRLLLPRLFRRLDDFNYLQLLAFLLGQCGRHSPALRTAKAALALDGADRSTRVFIASQLAAQKRHEEAAGIMLDLPDRSPTENELTASILLSLGRRQEALDEARAALTAHPDSASYLTLHATILGAMHRIEEAAADILKAQRLRPDDEAINRSAFVIATEAGDYDAALQIGAWLVARFPDEESISQTLKIVMERRDRQRLLDRVETGNEEPVLTAPDQARARLSADQIHPVAQQARIILALILRETKTRFGRARFGYFWVLFEPLAHIGIMITLISLFSHSNLPPIGNNFALFYFTGIVPYHLFTHTVSHMINAVPENRPLLQLPLVRIFDVFVARGTLELITEMSVAAILLLGFYCLGLFTAPDDITGIALAMSLIWITAFGLGLLFSILNSYFSGWERIWGALSSILYFSSGTFYIPRMMPESIRDILAWNPILQAIELIRSSYFYTPQPFWLNIPYLFACAFGSLAIGMTAQRLFRAKLMGTE